MSSLLHISDLHFGCELPVAVDALMELHGRLGPELVVASGDFTQRARHHEFVRARAFLARLGTRATLLVPGNHDLPLFQPWERLRDPYGRYRHYLHADLDPEFESHDLLVLGINSTSPYRLEDGAIPEARAGQVERRLQAARPEQLRIVVTHQPFVASRPRDRRRTIRGAEATLQRWTRAGVDLFLGGHSHIPFVLPLSAGQRSYCVQAGTGVSDRYRAGQTNSVNLIRSLPPDGGRRCVIERYELSQGAFELSEVSELELGAPSVLETEGPQDQEGDRGEESAGR